MPGIRFQEAKDLADSLETLFSPSILLQLLELLIRLGSEAELERGGDGGYSRSSSACRANEPRSNSLPRSA